MIKKPYILDYFTLVILALIGGISTYFLSLRGFDQYPIFILMILGLIILLFVKPLLQSKSFVFFMIYLLIASTFLNNAFLGINLGFFSLFPYRIALVFMTMLVLYKFIMDQSHKYLWEQIKVKNILYFLIFWLIYASVSLLWSLSVIEGIKYLSLLVMGLLFLFIIVFYMNKMDHLVGIHYIWMVMTVFLMVIGFYNHVTKIHLPSSTLYLGPEYKQHYPTAVFFNQNDFATYLSISVFFFISYVKNATNGFLKGVSFCLIFGILYLIYATDSRAALLGVFVGAAFYIYLLLPRLLKKISFWGALIGVIGVFIVFFERIYNKFFELFLASQEHHNFAEAMSSNMGRANLLKNSLNFILDTYGMGVGSGNAEVYMSSRPIYDTDNIVNIHFWFVEIFVNFGILIFLGYILLYAYFIWFLFRNYNRKMQSKDKLIIEALLGALVCFIVSSISPSSISNLFFHWVLISFVIATINYLKISKENKSLPLGY